MFDSCTNTFVPRCGLEPLLQVSMNNNPSPPQAMAFSFTSLVNNKSVRCSHLFHCSPDTSFRLCPLTSQSRHHAVSLFLYPILPNRPEERDCSVPSKLPSPHYQGDTTSLFRRRYPRLLLCDHAMYKLPGSYCQRPKQRPRNANCSRVDSNCFP